MDLAFDSFQKEYQVLLKGEMTHRVPIGTSAAGNIQRLDNALAGIPARLEKAEQQWTVLEPTGSGAGRAWQAVPARDGTGRKECKTGRTGRTFEYG